MATAAQLYATLAPLRFDWRYAVAAGVFLNNGVEENRYYVPALSGEPIGMTEEMRHSVLYQASRMAQNSGSFSRMQFYAPVNGINLADSRSSTITQYRADSRSSTITQYRVDVVWQLFVMRRTEAAQYIFNHTVDWNSVDSATLQSEGNYAGYAARIEFQQVGYGEYTSRQELEEAEERAKTLLLEFLTPEQKEMFWQSKIIPVTGGTTGTKYMVYYGRIRNIIALNSEGKAQSNLCAGPAGYPPLHDHLLAQVIALQYDEMEFLRKANTYPPLTANSIYYAAIG